ncbi:ankyrin repeat domain-containing protein 50-like [Mytilus trossulus]|uniref:ankyrin repeat domain-containing protein 50-like n=1 Tax=Mytilus trossulus TaxID=6551 RepID=UPI0030073C6B
MTEQDPNFFKYPLKLIKQEVINIKQRQPSSFVALCLLVLHNNTLDKKIFKTNTQLISNCVEMISMETEVDCSSSLVEFEKSLQNKLQLFVTDNGTAYVAVHDKMFDIITAILIPLMFSSVIKFGNSSLLSNRIQLTSLVEKSDDFVQLLPSELDSAYFERIKLDIEQGHHWDVFSNIQTRLEKYRHIFLVFLSQTELNMNTLGSDGSTPLFVSAYKGYTVFVKFLVEKCPEQIFQRDENNRSPLYIACKQGHTEVVQYLLNVDKDVHQVQNSNCTPFYVSCLERHIDIAKILLQHESMNKDKSISHAPYKKRNLTKHKTDMLINKPMDTGITPIIAAAYRGCVDIVEFLLKNNAALDITDDTNSTALHYACLCNHTAIARLLVRHGAALDLRDDLNQSPFFISCYYGNIDIIKVLLFGKHYSKRNRGGINDSSSSDKPTSSTQFSHHTLPIKKRAYLKETDVQGDTALHATCYNGHIEVGLLLIETGIDVNAVNNKGQTPLLVACANGFFNIAKLLIDHNANINQSDHEKFTPLLYASKGNLDTVELLIKLDCDINAKNCDNITALHNACRKGNAKIAKLLLDHGAIINACGGGGKTSLFYAARNNQLDVIEILLSSGAIVNHQEDDGGTPLQGACKNGHLDDVTHDTGVTKRNVELRRFLHGKKTLKNDGIERLNWIVF